MSLDQKKLERYTILFRKVCKEMDVQENIIESIISAIITPEHKMYLSFQELTSLYN